ncbi:PREDICTED: uncharacterized protein LOC109172226 [Ipomoea nil]|uniref:uncharacterized protein LOC109172226 n=1 Tax=Ipomoea nil TaxID=35883 RepID=UPI000901AD3A|nr:PREDICTED: uncharacterized protein LOC109172226 [Ipomoea nil]
MTAPCIQKDIANAIASEVTQIIINDLGEELFGIIVDESRDISVKEHMIVFIRYVDSSGHIVERLLGITHVCDTTSMSLKVAIEDLLTRHRLSISRIRGQGYDGASNMRGITNDLLQALQKKDQNIVNAMRLVDISKKRLQMMRDDGWEALLQEVSLFCNKHSIPIPNLDEVYVVPGRPRRKAEEMTHLHRYRVERFYAVLDLQLQELNNRFNEKNTELLLCVTCFDLKNSFARFDKDKLVQLA